MGNVESKTMFSGRGSSRLEASSTPPLRARWFLLLSLGFALFPSLTSHAAGEAGLRLETVMGELVQRAQMEGPSAARPMAETARRSWPNSPAVLLQLTEILIETEGIPRTFDVLDGMDDSIPSVLVDYARARTARAMGDDRRARRLAGRQMIPCARPLDRWARDHERARIAGLLPPDSLAAVMGRLEVTIRAMPPGTLRAHLDLRVRLLRVLQAVQGSVGDEQVEDLERIVRQARSSGLRWDEARLLLLSARLYSASGRHRRAERAYRRGYALADSLGALRTAGLARSYLGILLDGRSRYREAAELRERAATIFESLGDSLALAYALTGWGWDLDRTGDPQRSVEISSRALALWDAMGNAWGRAQVLNNLGVVHFNTGSLEKASLVLDEALGIARASGNRRQEAMILNNIAVAEDRRGRPDRAVEIYRELLAIHREDGDITGQLDVLNNLGLACFALGESDQALEFFRSAQETARRHGRFEARAAINRAMVLAESGELDAAEEDLRQARAQALQDGDIDALATAQAWLARVAERRGRLEEALRLMTAADSLQRNTHNDLSRIPTLIRLGRIQLDSALPSEAMRSARQADSLVTRLELDELAPAAAVLRAKIFLAEKKRAMATQWARRALDRWRTVCSRPLRFTDRSNLETSFCDALEVLVEADDPALRRDGDHRGALSEERSIELLRLSMEFHNWRQELPHRRPDALPVAARLDSLLERESILRTRVEDLRAEIFTSAGEDGRAQRLELAEVETALHACRRSIAEVDAPSSRALAPLLPSMEELARLSRGRVLLSYVLGPFDPVSRRSFVVRVGMWDGTVLPARLIRIEGDLRRSLRLWRGLLSRPALEADEERAERGLAAHLGELLLPPWLGELSPGTSVVIAADGALSDLPFCALIADGRRLVEGAAVARSASLPLWVQSRTRRPLKSSADLVVCRSQLDHRGEGGPHGDLAGAPEKARRGAPLSASLEARFRRSRSIDLEDIVRDLRRPPMGDAVREEQAWKEARVLHIASHGFFDPRRPWRSGLYAAAPASGDSSASPLLQQADLIFLDLHDELVTLAACETAQAEDSPLHASMESFAQGLQQAGARAVLGTYWKVDDAVADWCTAEVYRRLAEGRSLDEALRLTQLEMIAHASTRAPFHWAAWVVIGDGSQRIPLKLRRSLHARWYLGLGLVLLLSAAVIWRRRTISAR